MTLALSSLLRPQTPLPPRSLARAVEDARTLCDGLGGERVEFGAAFHELLFSCPPTGTKGLAALGMATPAGEIIPTDLKVLLLRCLAADPDVRPRSLGEVKQALQPHAEEPTAPRQATSRPLQVALALSLLGLCASLGFGAL